ncbi:uncharacterized protein PRCAT00001497001 [Priceomyces carsonii]|uniref:uncharacterized protein n=1 Tax=Priceomyces carsonii TaxID=28549 RepID=UPI002EDA3213|nr:unnamed protein product [Priceomyces carsonii]
MLSVIYRVKFIVKPIFFIYHLLYRIFWSGLNGRNIFQLVLNFSINFSPVFIWLMIFKNAGLIPKSIRPSIHVEAAMKLDEFIFNFRDVPFGSAISFLILLMVSYLFYKLIYSKKCLTSYYYQKEIYALNNRLPPSSSESSISTILDLEENSEYELSNLQEFDSGYLSPAPGDFQEDRHIGDLEYFATSSYNSISSSASLISKKILHHMKPGKSYRPYNCWYLAPPLLLAFSWLLLNIAYVLKDNINSKKDILAWFSYVICHFFVPLFTAIWLYVFHAPGALKLFSFGLGMQNIAGVLTHLLFPTAPPWYIHLDDKNKTASYDFPGYAAGLTRVDMAMGTHMHSKGFHMSPIVFGAVPSLHSAMATMVFFFISYYSRWNILKVLALCFVVLQWWATIYLDHHWRVDLLIGMFYSIIAYTILFRSKRGLKKVDRDFVKAKLRFDFKRGSTMGMRTFRNTKLQNFFDPLS